MRKLKPKKENKNQLKMPNGIIELGIPFYLIEKVFFYHSKIANTFAKLLSWNSDVKMFENMNELARLAKMKEKIIFKDKEGFNYYKTSELIKLFYKLPITNIIETESWGYIHSENNEKVFQKVLGDVKKIINPYIEKDCIELKVMFSHYMELATCGQILEKVMQEIDKYNKNLYDKRYKTFFTKMSKWVLAIQADIMNVPLEELERS